MKQIICFFIGHMWYKWRYIRSIGRYDEMLYRECKRCNKSQTYKGLTELTKTGQKVPYKK